MPEVVFPLDSQKKFTEQQIVGHNRWHPDIPAQVHVKPGDSVPGGLPRVVRRRDRQRRLGRRHPQRARSPGVHVLSGPIAVEGAEPGDLLIVDILDVGPIPQEDSGPLAGQGWGYTGVFATRNGGGFLTEQFPDAYKVIWDFRGGVATSRHVPGVSFTGIVHPGLMGTAPSADLLAKWNARETGPDRHRPEPGAAAGAAAAARTRRSSAASPATTSTGSPPRPPAPHRRARTAATRTSRTSPRAAGSSTRCSSTARSCRWVTCTSPRATARSRSAARSRWAGSWTCTST